MRNSLISTVAAVALIGASAPFALQAGQAGSGYQVAAGDTDQKAAEEGSTMKPSTGEDSGDAGMSGQDDTGQSGMSGETESGQSGMSGQAEDSGDAGMGDETDAANAEPPPPGVIVAQQEHEQTLAGNLIGTPVRTSAGQDAETIGDVADLVMGPDDRIVAAVVGVGGFLGVGEKRVAVKWSELEKSQADGEMILVSNLTRAQLEQAADFTTKEELARQQAREQEESQSGDSATSGAGSSATGGSSIGGTTSE